MFTRPVVGFARPRTWQLREKEANAWELISEVREKYEVKNHSKVPELQETHLQVMFFNAGTSNPEEIQYGAFWKVF